MFVIRISRSYKQKKVKTVIQLVISSSKSCSYELNLTVCLVIEHTEIEQSDLSLKQFLIQFLAKLVDTTFKISHKKKVKKEKL